jgi:mRNA interferase MazF
MTTASRGYPFRVRCRFQGKDGHVVLDQIRTVDRRRLVRELGKLSAQALDRSLRVLGEMFAPWEALRNRQCRRIAPTTPAAASTGLDRARKKVPVDRTPLHAEAASASEWRSG